MTARTIAAGALAAVVLACLIALALHRSEPSSDAAVQASGASGATPGRLLARPAIAPTSSSSPGPASDPSHPVVMRPLGSNELPDFKIDARGNLVIDAHTRDELERLLALNDGGDALGLLRQLQTKLPPIAYRQATDAFYAYRNYSIALAQAFPPGQSPVTDETAALRQLDALHALRMQQFGEETAQAYFGEEESTARRLLADMQAQPAGSGSFSQRAEQAQRQAPAASR